MTQELKMQEAKSAGRLTPPAVPDGGRWESSGRPFGIPEESFFSLCTFYTVDILSNVTGFNIAYESETQESAGILCQGPGGKYFKL